MLRYFTCLSIVMNMSCSTNKNENALNEIVDSMGAEFPNIVSNPEKHRLQILYTQINRNQKNEPIFKTFSFGVDTLRYFYPASSTKLPIAVLALEKARKINEIDIYDKFQILPGLVYKNGVNNDISSRTGYPSLAHSIRNLFIISDNSANNHLYDFLGRDYINKRLWDRSLHSTRIRHRLSVNLSDEENRFTHPMNFYDESKIIYKQQSQNSSLALDLNVKDFKIGKYHFFEGEKKNGPLDFSTKNYMNLIDQHELLKRLIFPENYIKEKQFKLNDSDYHFLYREMSILPRQSDYPSFSDYDKYYDGYCKFFLYGDTKNKIPENIKIFNKVGLAYGFVIDNAYIIDIGNKVEFLLTAVIYNNPNETMNDNDYGYEKISIPFLASLGRKIYDLELKRYKKILPDLKLFKNL
tara:strand:+ start:482 stop:1711 length:1230 start_codon:yes stop_codon:yes gene_type:complete